MSYPTGQVAEPTSFPTPMANVIDALKRLERIGSEHSDTTKKIIGAAASISKTIVGLYPATDEEFTIAKNASSSWDSTRINPEGKEDAGIQFVHYSIRIDRDAHDYGDTLEEDSVRRGLYNEEKKKFVSQDRDAALTLASDIATNRLLEYIEKNIQSRLEQDRAALSQLRTALGQLKTPGSK